MNNAVTIKRDNGIPEALKYSALRKTGIEHIEELARNVWTDYNSHDPGITFLEAISYVMTDLAYRTDLPIVDLLTTEEDAEENMLQMFPSARQSLAGSPVSELDYRKVFIAIDKVRNAWLTKAQIPFFVDKERSILSYAKPSSSTPFQALEYNGIYNILIELEDGVDTENEVEVNQIKAQVRSTFYAHRNLCEDIEEIHIVPRQKVKLCSEIEIDLEANGPQVYQEIITAIKAYLNPPVNWYSLEQMKEKGYSTESIFNGPSLKQGFLDEQELAASSLRTHVYLSDLVQLISNVSGVKKINKLLLNYCANEEVNMPFESDEIWCLPIKEAHQPFLCEGATSIQLFKDVFRVNTDIEEEVEWNEETFSQASTSYQDLPVPTGTFVPVDNHIPVDMELPAIYGVGKNAIPVSENPSQRKVLADQLRSYLSFYDQLMQAYLQQLGNVKQVLNPASSQTSSWNISAFNHPSLIDSAYTNEAAIPGLFNQLQDGSQVLNQLLDHLLARINESLEEYVFVVHRLEEEDSALTTSKIIELKQNILKEFKQYSPKRARGLDFYNDIIYDLETGQPHENIIWEAFNDQDGVDIPFNISGLTHRLGRLTGVQQLGNRFLLTLEPVIYKISSGKYKFKISHIESAQSFLTSSTSFHTYEEALARTDFVLEQAMEKSNYKIETVNGKFGYRLFDDNIALTTRSGAFDNEVEAGTEIDRLIELLKAHQTTIEGMYTLEPILLRPMVTFGNEPIAYIYINEIYQEKDDDAIDEYRFRVIEPLTNKIVLSSSTRYFSEEAANEELQIALELAVNLESFQLKTTKDGRFYFNIVDATQEVVARGIQYFATEELRAQAIGFLRSMLVRETIVVEDELGDNIDFLPVCVEEDCNSCQHLDPYSYRLHFILPGWTDRFSQKEYRDFFERTVRKETPAHILPRVCWVGRTEMAIFQKAYYSWWQCKRNLFTLQEDDFLEKRTFFEDLLERYQEENGTANDSLTEFYKARINYYQDLIDDPDLTNKLQEYIDCTNELIQIFNRLATIYPAGSLAECDAEPSDSTMVLGRSSLGILENPKITEDVS